MGQVVTSKMAPILPVFFSFALWWKLVALLWAVQGEELQAASGHHLKKI